MFYNKIVVVVKVNGKVLREDNNGEVKIPFNTEYSLYLKNLEAKKAVVRISIDGTDVLDGKKLIVEPNSDLELAGYLKDTTAKNKFKFIEKTKQIEDFRGSKVDDALIRVEWQFEKDLPTSITHVTYYEPYWYKYCYPPYTITPSWTWANTGGDITCGQTFNSACGGGGGTMSASMPRMDTSNNVQCSFTSSVSDVSKFSDAGITVKGNEIAQDFNYGFTRELEEQAHVIVLKLVGYRNNSKIETLVYAKDKVTCETCGTRNAWGNKFCTQCGTYLLD